jgi:hypothetical protein
MGCCAIFMPCPPLTRLSAPSSSYHFVMESIYYIQTNDLSMGHTLNGDNGKITRIVHAIVVIELACMA